MIVTRLTTHVVAAYADSNQLTPAELTALIVQVHAAFSSVGQPAAAADTGPQRPSPAAIRRSITPDTLVSFEDGRSYKQLKRHLTSRGMTPARYREKWSLPADYPMVAPNYSAARSAIAKAAGLGRKFKASTAPAPSASASPSPEPTDRKASDKSRLMGKLGLFRRTPAG